MDEIIEYQFKYKCSDCYDTEATTILKPNRKSCEVCNVKEVCYTEAGITISEGTEPVEKICPYTGNKLSLVAYKEIDKVPTIMIKMTKEQIKADRKKRSSDHFKKEIFPTLSKQDQLNFIDRYKDLAPQVDQKFEKIAKFKK